MSNPTAYPLPVLVRPGYCISRDARIQYVRQTDGWRLRAATQSNAEDISALFRLNDKGYRFPTRAAAHRALAATYTNQTPPVPTVHFADYYHVKGAPYTIGRLGEGWVVQSDDLTKSTCDAVAFHEVFGAGIGVVAFPTRRAALEALTAWRAARRV